MNIVKGDTVTVARLRKHKKGFVMCIGVVERVEEKNHYGYPFYLYLVRFRNNRKALVSDGSCFLKGE